MRGKLAVCISINTTVRITPADAGKTAIGKIIMDSPKDHPRRCGENCQRFRTNISYIGSPPQMRGKLAQCAPETCENRITPADAGKT